MKKIVCKYIMRISTESTSYFPRFSVEFANSLLRQLLSDPKDDGNIAISPSRLQTVLAILANFTKPAVQKRILEVIGNDVLEIDDANSLCNKDRLSVTQLDDDYPIPTIEIKTLLWMKEGLKVNQKNLDKISADYDVVLKQVDFTNPDTISIIDKTIDEATHGLVPEIQSDIQPDTQLLLTDILYFKAMWEAFNEEATTNCLFYGTRGKVKVPMMHCLDSTDYCESEYYQMVRLPYMCMSEPHKHFSMRIILPKKGYSLYEALYDIWNNEFPYDFSVEEVKLSLPRFTAESNINMKEILTNIGLGYLYESTDIIPSLVKHIQLSEIAQRVKIKVDESGTEAAALTYCCDVGCAMIDEKPQPIVMNVNRPFVFEIVEETTSTVLFTGVIKNIE